jgi:hypothetical protein
MQVGCPLRLSQRQPQAPSLARLVDFREALLVRRQLFLARPQHDELEVRVKGFSGVGRAEGDLDLHHEAFLAAGHRQVHLAQQARELHPGKRNALDALCERYQVDHSARTLHGALLDARLLSEVFLAMTRGQESLNMDVEIAFATADAGDASHADLELFVLRASDEELAVHDERLAEINKYSKGKCLWLALAGA